MESLGFQMERGDNYSIFFRFNLEIVSAESSNLTFLGQNFESIHELKKKSSSRLF